MSSVNMVVLLGRLGRDAELRYTSGGQAVSTLNLATSEVWNDKSGDRKERTEWHRVILWGKTAETLAPYLTKGKQVHVVGSLTTREWEKDGVKRTSTEIKGDKITLLGGGERSEDERPSRRPSSAAAASVAEELTSDDIPF